jgi:hypothetical protein
VDTKIEVAREDGISGLLERDPRADCECPEGNCRRDRTSAAANAGTLCKWWLSPVVRDRWGGDTYLVGRPTSEKLSVAFMFRRRDKGIQLQVFQALFQHWEHYEEEKQFPHYQLYVPTGDLRVSRRDAGLEEDVKKLKKHARDQVDGLLYEDKQAISLHGPLAPEAMQTIQDAVSELVDSLCGLVWGARV